MAKTHQDTAFLKGPEGASLTQCDQVGSPLSSTGTTHEKERTRFEGRLARYTEAKKRSSKVFNYIKYNEPTMSKEGEKLKTCGSYLVFRNYIHTGKYKLISGISCDKHLLCPLCAIRRSAKQYYKYKERFDQVMSERPDLELVMFTITVKNKYDLQESWDHLYESMKKLLQKRRNAKKGQSKTIFKILEGAVWSYEVTNKGRGWHPHIHGIGLIPKGFDPKKIEVLLKEEWHSITGDSHQLKVEFPKSRENQTKAFFEVFKYALKVNDLSIPKQIQVYKTLKGRRFTASFGVLYGVKIDDKEPLEDSDLQDYVDMVYRFNGQKYDLIEADTPDQDYDNKELKENVYRTESNIKNEEYLKSVTSTRESQWAKQIETYVKKMRRLESTKIYSGHLLNKRTIAFALSVKDMLMIGKMKSGHLKFSKPADHVGIHSEGMSKKQTIIKRNNYGKASNSTNDNYWLFRFCEGDRNPKRENIQSSYPY